MLKKLNNLSFHIITHNNMGVKYFYENFSIRYPDWYYYINQNSYRLNLPLLIKTVLY